jgi:hypothetical protein
VLRLEGNTASLSTALNNARKVARKCGPKSLNLLWGQKLRVARASLEHLIRCARKEASGSLDTTGVGDIEASDKNSRFAFGVESGVV